MPGEQASPSPSSPIRQARVARGILQGTSAAFLVDCAALTSDDHLKTPRYQTPPSPFLPKKCPQLNRKGKLDAGLILPSSSDLVEENHQLRKKLFEAAKKLEEASVTIRANNAQMVLQHLHNEALKTTLRSKERRPKTDRTQLFPGGKGRHLTGDEFTTEVKKQVENRLREAEEVVHKRTMRAEKAQETRDIQQVARIKRAAYDTAMKAYTAICSDLRAQGIRVKDLPLKPKFPRKKKAVEVPQGGDVASGGLERQHLNETPQMRAGAGQEDFATLIAAINNESDSEDDL